MDARLNDLLELVRAAQGPDRELDAAIAVAVGLAPADAFVMNGSADPGILGTGPYSYYRSPEFTASIDAAVALCERLLPGWKASHGEFSWSFGFQDERVWTCKLRYYRTKAHAPTLPLAILAGLLQALISQEQK